LLAFSEDFASVSVLSRAPRLVAKVSIWEFKGTAEASALAICFGLTFLTAYVALSTIVGAFIAGVAVAGSRVLIKAKEFIESQNLLFGTAFSL